VDDSGRGALTAAGLSCGSCGTELPPNSKFCNKCGTPVAHATQSAEYKQVTVLFADVVHSMDIAAAVGAERLREIMAELLDRSTAVVKRYGGTVDKFTGDGIMAMFGAPVALEDHAVRACLAALGVQEEARRLAVDIQERDGVDLQLRVGLNSGQVIAGEIGSGPFGYTAVGEQVGMAQRMESVAPPGTVMLSASAARLVDGAAALSEPELVQIKGADEPVAAYRLLGIGDGHRAVGRGESALVGRRWEMAAIEGLLERVIDGHGAVVTVVGSPGIGKSRLVREVSAMAAARGVEVFTGFCESHTSQVPFHAVARLLRAITGITGLHPQAARARIRAQFRDADPEDLLLFDDLLGVADPEAKLPKIDPDARRRRLTALVNAASLARETPRVYVIEDAHWIDGVSDSMLAAFVRVIPQTPSLVLVTYRPEYDGALARVHGAQTLALAPLNDSETKALVSELLGSDASVGALGQTIAERAAGNPFFAEEIVRELVERGVLRGHRSAYSSTADLAEVSMPATVQATIAARIDRLDPAAKRTLSAAAVIGSKFSRDLLERLGIDPVLDDLVGGELIDQITFTDDPAYVFHHPLIRTVAYESQLKSDRAELHRRVAAAIESRDPAAAEENAALIAEHLKAAGELHAAYGWHMRAATWLTIRDINAALTSWRRARQVADALPADDPGGLAMRIAPRALICATSWRAGGSAAEATGFDELRDLAYAAGDKASLAMGMAGLVLGLLVRARYRESSQLASEFTSLVESIGDPSLTAALLWATLGPKLQMGEITEVIRLAQRVIDLADGDPHKGYLVIESPLAVATLYRGVARACRAEPGWKDEIERGAELARVFASMGHPVLLAVAYGGGISNGTLRANAAVLRETAAALEFAQRQGDDLALASAQLARGIALVQQDGPQRAEGLDLLDKAREPAVLGRFNMPFLPHMDMEVAKQKARTGDLDGAIKLLRFAVDDEFNSGEMICRGAVVAALVELLLDRSAQGDIPAAEATVQRLAAVPVEPGFVLFEVALLRLRALLARAHGDDTAYAHLRDRYRDMANTLGFEGHIAWAEAMP
jgi:class 3 adenylate cyclase